MPSLPPVDPAAPETQSHGAGFTWTTFQTGHEWQKQHRFSLSPGKQGSTVTVYEKSCM